MKQFVRFSAIGVLLLLLGVGTATGQEVAYTSAPSVSGSVNGSNGGFAWGDVNGDGRLDLWIPPYSILYNNITSFALASSTKTGNVGGDSNTGPGLLADINGDGVLDLWSTVNTSPHQGLYYDSAGTFVAVSDAALAAGDGSGNVFYGMSVADIDHSNYLTAAWARFNQTVAGAPYGDTQVFPPGLGVAMFKRGAAGFTNVGTGADPANLAIDTELSFESWQVHFLDANNDGYPDLLMPGMRHGLNRFYGPLTDTTGARYGSVLFLNDGTGKFAVPTAASLGRTIYSMDSVSAGVSYGHSVQDGTGIIVDDTLRHFAAIGSAWGELNNDGYPDVLFVGLAGTDNWNGNGAFQQIVVLYGKADGTFTYKWNGTDIASNGLPQEGIRAWDVGDYNNDGIPDLFASPNFSGPRMFRGNGNGTFSEVTSQLLLAGGGGRGGGFVDYDNDGFMDIYTQRGGSTLMRNGGNSNHWIAFTPVGTGNNKSAIGARFTLYTQGGTVKQTRFIKADGGTAGGQTLRANFGIGVNTSIDSVAVRWPDGTQKTYTGLAVDKYWTVIQGSENPAAPALTAPANNATGTAQTGNLTWGAAAGATSYQVQVSMDPTFADAALLAVDTEVSGTTYAYSLGAATKYYWRVAAINGGFMSGFSAANNFTTSGAAPAVVPTLSSPADAATNQPAAITLTVGAATGAARYEWQVSTLSTFSTLYATEVTAGTSYSTTLAAGRTYYWRVRAVNDLGATAYSAASSFSVQAAPARPSLSSPANNSVNVIVDSVSFVWTSVSGAASYNLRVTTISSTSTYTTTDTTYKLYSLSRNTNYTWAVEAINAGGTSHFTGNFAFTTVPNVPAAPAAIAPASAAAGVALHPYFTWSPSVNATKYRLQVASDNAFATVVSDTTVIDTTALLATQLAANSDYYWRVRAENQGGAGAYSTARLFTTGTVLDVEETGGAVPKEFALLQNYPNPFNPSTIISYSLPKASHVTLTVFDVLGRVVATLVDGVQTASNHRVEWNASGISSGMYFYRIHALSEDGSGSFTATKKLVLMK